MDFFDEMMYHQQVMAQQQEEMNYQMMIQNQQLMGMKMKKTTRKDVLSYLQQRAGTNEYILIDEFETEKTRHICIGTNEIKVLSKGVENVPTSEGYLAVEYFLCPNCKKLILNKGTLEMY